MGGKLPRPGTFTPGGQAAQRQLHPLGQAAQGGGQDTPGYLHPWGASCPEAVSPPGGKLPRVQDKPVHPAFINIAHLIRVVQIECNRKWTACKVEIGKSKHFQSESLAESCKQPRMSSQEKCTCNNEWERYPAYSEWIRPYKGDKLKALCSV